MSSKLLLEEKQSFKVLQSKISKFPDTLIVLGSGWNKVLVARSFNIKTLGLAFVTNLAFVKHDHKEVLAEADKAGKKMRKLLLSILQGQLQG